jgi:hypothetical protein
MIRRTVTYRTKVGPFRRAFAARPMRTAIRADAAEGTQEPRRPSVDFGTADGAYLRPPSTTKSAGLKFLSDATPLGETELMLPSRRRGQLTGLLMELRATQARILQRRGPMTVSEIDEALEEVRTDR